MFNSFENERDVILIPCGRLYFVKSFHFRKVISFFAEPVPTKGLKRIVHSVELRLKPFKKSSLDFQINEGFICFCFSFLIISIEDLDDKTKRGEKTEQITRFIQFEHNTFEYLLLTG